jgi:hypothetical protein
VERLVGAVMRAGYSVWWDKDLPPHLSYGDVITQQIQEAKAAIVIWSGRAGSSQWVRAEADLAREHGKLIQASVDGTTPPLPFNQIQFVSIADWQGEADHPGWLKILESLRALCGPGAGAGVPAAPTQPPVPAPSQPPVSPLTQPPAPAPTRPPAPFPAQRGGKSGSFVLIGIITLSVAALIAVGLLVLTRGKNAPAPPASAPATAPVAPPAQPRADAPAAPANPPAGASSAEIVPDRLVTIGGPGAFQEGCQTGHVSGLDPNGDNFLALRGRPGAGGAPLEELGPGREVLVCDTGNAGGSAWFGIVYGPNDPENACGIPGTPAESGPYRGSCNSGWVSARFVVVGE